MREKFVTKAELELERSPAELKTWVETKVQYIAQQPDGKTAIRLGHGFVKQLMEEVRPIALFAARHFRGSSDIVIKPIIGSQGHDAIVTSKSGVALEFRYIEVTQAHDGEDEHLRMIHLEREGHVSLHGSITKKGTQRTGLTVTVEGAALDHVEVVSRELHRINDAALKKVGKPYQSDTALVIQFEDFASFIGENDLKRLDHFVREKVLPHLKQFRLLALVGAIGNYYLEYPIEEVSKAGEATMREGEETR